jgi:DNA-directed RNA polymerase subunit omega
LRDDYIQQAQKVITDPHILINVVSRRVKQLKAGSEPTVESLEKLALEDIALLEIINLDLEREPKWKTMLNKFSFSSKSDKKED